MDPLINLGVGVDTIVGSATKQIGATVVPEVGVKPEQVDNFFKGVAGAFDVIGAFTGGGPPFPNELRDFASYNYIFTLGCLNNFEINFPDITYRVSDPSTVILKSGGGAGSGAATAYEGAGKVEYYIANV